MTTRSYTVIYTGAGEPIVHATGCTHNVRDSLRGAYTSEEVGGTLEDVAAHVFSDMIEEDPDSLPADFLRDMNIKPCAC